MATKKLPDKTQPEKKLPTAEIKEKEMPIAGNPANTVFFNGKLREIKPTKLKYFRSNTAGFYSLIEQAGLANVFSWPGGIIPGDDRDGDKMVFDWLMAVFDEQKFVDENYNDATTEEFLETIKVFKKVNKLDKQEQERKNAVKNQEPEVK